MITTNANPALEKAIETVKVDVVADPAGCGDLFNPVGTRVFTAPCDTARAFLAQQSVKYSTTYGPAGSGVKVVVNGKDVPYTAATASNPQVLAAVQAAGYPKPGDAGIVKMSNPFDIFRAAGRGDDRTAVHPGDLRHHGVRADRGDAGRTVPDQDPLHLDVAALSHRQRLVRRTAARHRVRDRGLDRRYLRRSLVSDHLRVDHRGRRLLLPAGNQGRRYQDKPEIFPAALPPG